MNLNDICYSGMNLNMYWDFEENRNQWNRNEFYVGFNLKLEKGENEKGGLFLLCNFYLGRKFEREKPSFEWKIDLLIGSAFNGGIWEVRFVGLGISRGLCLSVLVRSCLACVMWSSFKNWIVFEVFFLFQLI